MSAPRPGDASPPVLEVRDLDVSIHGEAASFLVVRNMAFAVRASETLAIVGESGCGKSMTALSLMRLEAAAAAIERGSILLEGADLRELPQAKLEDLRGRHGGTVLRLAEGSFYCGPDGHVFGKDVALRGEPIHHLV